MTYNINTTLLERCFVDQCHLTSVNQCLCQRQRRQRRETLGTRLSEYLVNHLDAMATDSFLTALFLTRVAQPGF